MAAHGYEPDRFEAPVSKNFYCAICLNVLKDPVSCRQNEHLFCRGCITRSLSIYKRCPVCQDGLNVATLSVAPRVLSNYLSELRIRCEFFNRGCRQFIKLDDLERHVDDCGFAPAVCSDEGCQLEVNKSDLIYHETVVCDQRRVKCHSCENLTHKVGYVNKRMRGMERKINRLTNETMAVNATLHFLEADNERRDQEILASVIQPLAKIARKDNSLSLKQPNRSDESIKVIVAGGLSSEKKRLDSVETFNISDNTWLSEFGKTTNHCRASAVRYHNQMLITGGEKSLHDGYYPATNEILRMNMDVPLSYTEFTKFPAQLPGKLSGHCSVVCNDLMYVLGGRDENGTISDSIHEIQLVPPYCYVQVARMPVARWNHSVQLFGDRIVCVGGEVSEANTDSSNSTRVSGSICNTDSVLEYDITRKVCKELAPLSNAVSEAATVKIGDNIIVIWGVSSNGSQLSANTCLMYNVRTQICDPLPSLNEARRGCVAVVHGKSIMVMGGRRVVADPTVQGKKIRLLGKCLQSVEEFRFERYSWEIETHRMKEARYLATAIVY